MNKSRIKTWFKRHGFKPSWGTFRADWQYCRDGNRQFRVRNNSVDVNRNDGPWVVDICDNNDSFDRWANSTILHAVPIEEFIKWYEENKGVTKDEELQRFEKDRVLYTVGRTS